MAIDYGLVLSAGFGTRMGLIGKFLPKILWPVFEKTLLELQVMYLKSLGCQKIYVNSHFLHESISKKFPLVSESARLIHEPKLLGSGGTIHHIAHLNNYKGLLLFTNGDQFIFPGSPTIKNATEKTKEYSAILFSIEVARGYSELIVKHDLLEGIENAPKKEKYLTYSGMGLVNLSKLNKHKGESNFFDSVVNPSKGHTLVVPGGEYWDFGTDQRYFHSLFKLLSEHKSAFFEFCLKQKAFLQEKSSPSINSYNHSSANTINLSPFPVENPKRKQSHHPGGRQPSKNFEVWNLLQR